MKFYGFGESSILNTSIPIEHLDAATICARVKAYKTQDHVNAAKAMVAMSGGVDSTVAVALMIANGYHTSGGTLRLRDTHLDFENGKKSCCSQKDIDDAGAMCKRLGVTHHVLDRLTHFESDVILPFIEAYQAGATPNPCVDCNRRIKFKTFFEESKSLGFDYLATGHYARVKFDPERNRYLLLKGKTVEKDQSYVLYTLSQAQLARLRFPCGEYSKTEIREIARALGLSVADKPDSQDICFIPSGDYHQFMHDYASQAKAPMTIEENGEFIDLKTGQSYGLHKGFSAYTIGQRKGLGIAAGRPVYVVDKDPLTKTVYLGDESDLWQTTLEADQTNWILFDRLEAPYSCTAKIRYGLKETACTIEPLSNDRIRVTFAEPIRAITKGQSIVFYNDEYVVGGGKIATQGVGSCR